MEPESHRDILEENLERLLRAGAGQEHPQFQEQLVRTVRQAVGEQRRAARIRLLRRGWPAAVAAAAALTLAWILLQPQAQGVDWVQPLYGAVAIVDGDSIKAVAAGEPIHTGQWVRTLSGSKAQILMQDGTKLTLLPRTTLQITDGKRGSTVGLREGTVTIEAAKQRGGRRLAVETPGARIRTLGTVFDVRLAQRPDGTRQTWVGVTSGLVQLESGGDRVLLGAHTEGLAEEGQPPQKHLADWDLDQMHRLLDRNAELARQQGKEAGACAILEFRNADLAVLWTVVRGSTFKPATDGGRLLRLKSPAAQARLFTLDGGEIPVRRQGRALWIDGSAMSPGPSADNRLILQLQEVKGMLQVENGDVVHFTRPAGASDSITLLQFRLPGQASLQHILPKPIEVDTTPDRTTITVAASIEGLEVSE